MSIERESIVHQTRLLGAIESGENAATAATELPKRPPIATGNGTLIVVLRRELDRKRALLHFVDQATLLHDA